MNKAREPGPAGKNGPAAKLNWLAAVGVAIISGAVMYLAFSAFSGGGNKRTHGVAVVSEKSEKDAAEIKVDIFKSNDNLSGLEASGAGMPAEVSQDDRALMLANLAISMDGGILFPPGTAAREAMVYDGTAVISMDGGFRRRFKGGAWAELLAVYAIVNTVTGNMQEVKKVSFLMDDARVDMFARHVDISRPFQPANNLIIAKGDAKR